MKADVTLRAERHDLVHTGFLAQNRYEASKISKPGIFFAERMNQQNGIARRESAAPG